ncbi:MAG: Gfo/Idh/MocA family oxidoreductase, partial [Spirosomataceae bacterium]
MPHKPAPESRRAFLVKAATAALTTPLLFSNDKEAPAKLRHACIGVGGMGWGDLQQFKKHDNVEIVALCDVDEKNLKRAAEFVPGAKTYIDWRELFKAEATNIDSVNVSVPDHNHFPIA